MTVRQTAANSAGRRQVAAVVLCLATAAAVGWVRSEVVPPATAETSPRSAVLVSETAKEPVGPLTDTSAEATCFAEVDPVIRLDIPSRYKTDSKNRSDFDKAGNAAVEAALQPVDDFIVELARAANRALAATAPPAPEAPPSLDALADAQTAAATALASADCVVDRIHGWAEANALSDLDSQGAKLSAPGRVAGIAIAYALVRPLATPGARQAVIESWLRARSRDAMTFFDTEAPPRASQNNLRAWAALEAAQVGILLDDTEILDWAAASIQLVACTANPDGSLPNEMWRGKLALHYHIHAVSPLVVGAALLAQTRPGLFQACDNAIPRIAGFAIAAAQDPKLAEAQAGKPQSFNPDPAKLKAYEFAWIPAYLSQIDDPAIAGFGNQFKALGNSKLGGDQSLIWN